MFTSRTAPLLIAAVITVALAGHGTSRAAYDPAATQPSAVKILDQTWHDPARDRDVPVKIFYPADATGPCPVILFSHGLGASNELYGYLGHHWAEHGYVAVHMTHHGSDTMAVIRNGLTHIGQTGGAIARDPKNATDRCQDVSFVIDRLTALNTDASWALHGRLDLDKIGLAGHSFGGNTALMIAGQTFGQLGEKSFTDKRVKCIVAISPPMVVTADQYQQSLAGITIPVMIVSGTLDNAPIGKTANLDRVAAFPFFTHAPADLLVVTGADHQAFVGSRMGKTKPGDDRAHLLVQQAGTAFFDAYLKNDAAAKAWLEGGDFGKSAGKDADFSHREN